MESIAVNLMNVGIVILAIALAIYLWVKPKPIFNATMVLTVGVSVYTLDILLQIKKGACVLSENGSILKTIQILNSCLDSVSRPVFAAQVLILGGVVVIFFNPLFKIIKSDIDKMRKDEGSNE